MSSNSGVLESGLDIIGDYYFQLKGEIEGYGFEVIEVNGPRVRKDAYALTDFREGVVEVPTFLCVLDILRPEYRPPYTIIAGLLRNYFIEHEREKNTRNR